MYPNKFRQQDRKLELGQSYQMEMPSNQAPEKVIGSMGRKGESFLFYALYIYRKKVMNSKQKQDTSSRDERVKTNSTKKLLQVEYLAINGLKTVSKRSRE